MIALVAKTLLAFSLMTFLPTDAGVLEDMARGQAPVVRWEDAWKAAVDAPIFLLHAGGSAPRKRDEKSLGVVTQAASALVVDRASGTVLLHKNRETPRSIGSITKLMTAYLFLQGKPDVERIVTLEAQDVRAGGIQHVALGDPLHVRDVLLASLVGSDNTATAALVRLSGETETAFVARMNEQARAFGMRHTHFADAAGLSQDNRSTAADIAILIDEVMRQSAFIAGATQLPVAHFTGGSGRAYAIESTNELFGTFVSKPPYVFLGGKTGFLPEAGYSFGAVFHKEGSGELLVVVLGTQEKHARFADVKALVEWAYRVYAW